LRVALAPEGTRGDVEPLLALGERLRGRGHEVRVCAPPDFGPEVRARGFAHHPVGGSVRELLAQQARAFAGSGWALLRAVHGYLREEAAAQCRDLPEALEGCDFAIGAGVQLGAPSVAERLGIPYRYVVYCPAIIPSRHYPPMTVAHRDLPAAANRLLWWLLLRGMNALVRGTLDRQRAALGLDPVDDVYRHLLTPRPVLAADPLLAEPPPDAPFALDRTACLHPHREGPLPPKLEDFLAAGPRPVYIGFGSMTDPRPAETTRRLLEAVRFAGCRAVVSRGWAGLAEGPLPEGVLAVGDVDHASLFPHMAAVVHHGGAGTTHTASRAGVPQIVVPHVLDQFYWAHRVHALGVAPPPLPRRRLTTGALAAHLIAVLENELLVERARELAERLRVAREAAPPWDVVLQRPVEDGRP
jgi:vancomycin aglycone glucosyltransferase